MKDLYLHLVNIRVARVKKEWVETQCIAVSANTGYRKDVTVSKEDWLIHQILNVTAAYIHLTVKWKHTSLN